MSLSKYINTSENRDGIGIYALPMDGENIPDESDITISCEEVVKTRKKKKSPNPKWYNHFLECLDQGLHKHMLSYVPNSNKKEFTIVFIDRKNKGKWRSRDISLFEDLDEYMKKTFNRQRSEEKPEEDVKTRFKSNLWKCLGKFVKKIGEDKIEKYKTVKTYEILWRPGVSAGESSNDGGRVSKNKGKTNRKGNKKNNSKEINLSRRNFLTNPESVPQMGSHSEMIRQMGKQEIVNFESIPQMGEQEITNFEMICQMGKQEIANFESIRQMDVQEIANFESIRQMDVQEIKNFESIRQTGKQEIWNFVSIPQTGKQEIWNFVSIPQTGKQEIKNFESMTKGEDKNENFENNHLNGIPNLDFVLPQGEMHVANVYWEDNIETISQPAFEEKNNSHYLRLSENSQIKTGGSEHVNSGVNLENLKIYPMGGDFNVNNDIKTGGSEHVNSGVNLENLKIYPVGDFNLNNDIKTGGSEHVNSGVYLENLKIYPMGDFNLNNDGGFGIQGNHYGWKNGRYITENDEYWKGIDRNSLKSDPFMCSGPFQTDLSSLGASDDWSCVYQELL